MPISFTDEYYIDKNEYARTGAFDMILDVDSRVFIDPTLLDSCKIHEFKNSKAKVEKYFSNIVLFLSHSKNSSDRFWKEADKLLSFRELTGTCTGYSRVGTSGNAIGPILRTEILGSIKELIDAGEKDPDIFELLGVFQENIGCDRISDLVTYILAPEILLFTQRIINKFSLSDTQIVYKQQQYKTRINKYNHKPIMLLPSLVLSPLPVFDGFDSIDIICAKNEQMRQAINEYFDLGHRRKLSKTEIYSLMKSNSDFREALLAAYKNTKTSPYDFEQDIAGEYVWYQVAKDYVAEFPLALKLPKKATILDIILIVQKICEHFKTLIEDNGLWSLLYSDDKKPKHERAAQLLFFGVADAYCRANNIDLSREINNGRGSVDFKLSNGAKNKVLVEIKLTSNGQLQHGFLKQVPIYMKQERTQRCFYLIIDNCHPRAMMNFIKLYENQSKEVKKKIPCVKIEGKPPESASRA